MGIIPAGFGEITADIAFTGDPKVKNVVFGVDNDNVITQLLTDAISLQVGNFLRACMTSDYTFTGITATYEGGSGTFIFTSVTGAGAGTDGSNSVSKNTALLWRKNTGLGGRRNRGRMFTPGANNADIFESGVVATAKLTTLTALGADFIGDLSTAGAPMVLLHSSAPTTPVPVTSLVPQPLIATQRRRLR